MFFTNNSSTNPSYEVADQDLSNLDAANDPVISESEVDQQILIPNSLTEVQLNQLQKKASRKFKSSRSALYESLALSYFWYQAAKSNPKYLETCFEGFAKATNEARYRNSIKFCLGIEEGKQASSVSKYARCLLHAEQQLGSETDFSEEVAFVEKFVSAIESAGGLDAIASPEKQKTTSNSVSDKSTPPKLAKLDTHKRMADLMQSPSIARVQWPKKTELPPSGLVTVIARVNNDAIEIVHMQGNKPLLERCLSAPEFRYNAVKNRGNGNGDDAESVDAGAANSANTEVGNQAMVVGDSNE